VYDSRAPLECSAHPLRRKIGVLASAPFHHYGLNASYVDVQLETVSIGSGTYGNCYPAETAEQEIRRATERTIADLDKAITELTAHRDRLTETLGKA
jgi:hypothetical protein